MYSGFRALRGRAAARAVRNISIRRNTRSASATCSAPGNIVAEIAALNRIRRAQPGLQIASRPDASIRAYNDQVLLYGKRDAGGRAA